MEFTDSQKAMITNALNDKIKEWQDAKKAAINWDRLQNQFHQQILAAESIIETLEFEEGD